MKGHSVVSMGDRLVCKRFNANGQALRLYHAEVAALEDPALEPLVPEAAWALTSEGAMITMARYQPFADFAAPLKPADAGRLVVDAVKRMNEAGWAHRDLNLGNLVWDQHEGCVRFIDWEFATRVQSGKPYDLYGPAVSGVSPPGPHRNLGISVWWSTKRDFMLALERHFGPVAE